MIAGLLKKIFGSRNDRLIRQYSQKVRAINALEPKIQGLSDVELRGNCKPGKGGSSPSSGSKNSSGKPIHNHKLIRISFRGVPG